MNIDISSLNPWKTLLNVIELLIPLVAFALAISCVIYMVLATMARSAAPDTARRIAFTSVNFGFLTVSSYVGIVLGMFVKMIGGFNSLGQSTEAGTVLSSIGSVLILSIGVLGQYLTDSNDENARKYNRPISALALLLCFIVSGFYWKLLV